MRILLNALCLAAVLAAGCVEKKASAPQENFSSFPAKGSPPIEKSEPAAPPPVISPANGLTGRIVSVNATARFVVLSFPGGHLPAADLRMNVYRHGVKVGEVKVTGPQLNQNVVADLAEGEAEPGDEVR